MQNCNLTAEELRRIVHYDPETGLFTWLHREGVRREWNTCHAGKNACSSGASHGYFAICINSKKYLSHRLAWLYMTGEWPEEMIDHINMNRTDNRFCNLRCATREQNYANKGVSKRNTSGLKGIYFHKASGLWHASAMRNRKKYSLGYFHTPDKAAKAYAAFAKDFDGEFAHESIKAPN